MLQLEKRFYTRSEVAQITGARLDDAKHFKRNAENVLTKWGYRYDWMRSGVAITYIPTTAEERLAEIMIRQYGLDIQIDCRTFAYFITAFIDIAGFDSMPWEERAKVLFSEYGVEVTDRTLRNWCSKLIGKNVVSKTSGVTYWKTDFIDGRKQRTQVQREETAAYYARRAELVRCNAIDNMLAGMGFQEAYKTAWNQAYTILWDELHCCYYYCKTFLLTAFSENDPLLEIYELAREIAGQNNPQRFS